MERIIDTGDNAALGMRMLPRVKKLLVQEKRCHLLRNIIDSSARFFGFEAISKDGIHFYCVARSSKPIRPGILNIVSCQKRLMLQCQRESKPVVMYWPEQFTVFDAHVVLLNNYGENTRADLGPNIKIQFINFNAKLGIEWFGKEALLEVWRKAKMFGRRDLRIFMIGE